MSLFYAVAKGRSVGIYNTKEEWYSQVYGFKGAKYEKFDTYQEAYRYLNENGSMLKDVYYVYVDGSCKDNIATYGLVFVKNDNVVIKDFGKVTTNSKSNVMGELTASMRAVELAIANCFSEIVIVYGFAKNTRDFSHEMNWQCSHNF